MKARWLTPLLLLHILQPQLRQNLKTKRRRPRILLQNKAKEEEEELTYQNTQTSNVVCIAKELLKDGQFDEALDTISQEMSRITSLLGNDEQGSMHECMAPLYYLYGTTLLYSIEESTDNVAAPTMNQGGDDDDDDEDLDDLQIAWENLETARHITQRIVDNATTTCIPEIQMDLSRIHLRLGDLTRANGQHFQAIAEYEICLDMRKALFGLYHNKVSEVQFVLAQAYMMLASEADKEDSELNLTPQQVEEYRCKSIQLHVECSKSFAGQIANLCNASPQEITTVDRASKLGNPPRRREWILLKWTCRWLVKSLPSFVNVSSLLLPTILLPTPQSSSWPQGTAWWNSRNVGWNGNVQRGNSTSESHEGHGQGGCGWLMVMGNVVENADGSTTTIGFGTEYE